MFLLDYLVQFIDIVLHLDVYLPIWLEWMGPWLYLVLFLIIFAETGLVVTPFLPGDSLLFAVGALTVLPNGLDIGVLSFLLVFAAFLGDNVNYRVGRWIGVSVFKDPKAKFLNPKNLEKTQNFFNKYGVKAVILARFVPLVRTFVPFVAGVGRMPFKIYLLFSVLGAILWTQIFLWAGRIFGNLPAVKANFHVVIVAVIVLSLVPIFYEWVQARRKA